MSAAIRPPHAPAAQHAQRAALPQAPGTASGFASLLDPGTNAGNSLGNDIVEVFNAHGFFLPATEAAGKVGITSSSEARTSQSRPAAVPDAQQVAPSRPKMQVPSDGDPAVLPSGTLLDLSANARAGGMPCAFPTRPSRAVLRPPHDDAAGRLALASTGKTAAANKEAPVRGSASRPPVKDARTGATLPERLLFQIGAQSVAITGWLNHLGPDEQERLLERLSALLAAHGLGLGEVSLNGRAILQYFQRSGS